MLSPSTRAPLLMTPSSLQSPANQRKIQHLLFDAISRYKPALAKKRLEQGASPSLGNTRMITPLMLAASNLSGDLIKHLAPLNDLAATDFDGRCALHHFLSGLSRYRHAQPPKDWRCSLRALLSRESARIKSSEGLTPFLFASAAWRCDTFIGIEEVISELSPFSDLSATDNLGRTATAIALLYGNSGSDIPSALFRADPLKNQCLELPLHPRASLAHLVAARGSLDFLKEIAPLANLDASDLLGRTPMMAAAIHGHFSSVDVLLSHGADSRRVDVDGCDALMLAIEPLPLGCDDEQWLRLMPLASESDLFFVDSLGESAQEKAIDRQLPSFASALEALACSSTASLSTTTSAAFPRRKEKLSQLLFSAIGDNDPLLLKKRLGQGADPKEPFAHSKEPLSEEYPMTPLMAACRPGTRSEVIRVLRPLSDISAVDAFGDTALSIYLRSHAIDSSEALFNLTELLSPEVAAIANDFGRTPLSQLHGSPEFCLDSIKLLAPMSDWNAVTKTGKPVVNFEHEHSSPGTAPLIFQEHPDKEWLASFRNPAGETLFHHAACAGNLSLLNTMASSLLLGSRDNHGNTPLMSIFVFRQIFSCCETVALLAPWSDCRSVNENGCDALMLAIENSRGDSSDLLEVIKILAPRSDLAFRDFLGESALDKAISYGLNNAAEALLARLAIEEERDALASATLARPSSRPSPSARSSTRI